MQSVNEENLLASDRANNHKSSKKGSKCRNMTKPPESQPIVEQAAEPLPETIPMNGVDFDEDEDHSEVGKGLEAAVGGRISHWIGVLFLPDR
jgi:hypothetical protein